MHILTDKKLFLVGFFVLASFLILPKIVDRTVNAEDFNVAVDLSYSVNETGEMKIAEKRTVNNYSYSFYIPSSSKEVFVIKSFKNDLNEEETKDFLENVKKSLRVVDEKGTNLDYVLTEEDDELRIEVGYGSDLKSNRYRVFELQYSTAQLVEQVGNIFNIYVPGFGENYNKEETDDSGASTKVQYSVTLLVNKSLGTANFIAPEPTTSSQDQINNIYSFGLEQLVGESVWLQIGDKQYYKFKIIEPVTSDKTNIVTSILKDTYELLLPSDSLNGNQKVYYSNFSIEPISVTRTSEGNLLAKFKIDPSEVQSIEIEGMMVVNNGTKEDFSLGGNIADLQLNQVYFDDGSTILTLEDLTVAQQYWEVDSPEIASKALELKGDMTDVYDIVLADYKFVVDNVNYDDLKLGTNNTRQGALNTLKGGSAVCMEYSDLLITLLRAQGIPSRAIFGYSYDPKNRIGQNEGHQWVEAFIPNIGWVSLDPTWGDTGRRDYIGVDLDHALWYVAGQNVDEPSKVVRYSYGNTGEVSPPQFEITAIKEVPVDSYLTQDQVLGKYPAGTSKELSDYLEILWKYKIVIVVVIVLLASYLLIYFLSKLGERFMKKVEKENSVRVL